MTTTLKLTPENKATIAALKTINQTQWVGEITHDTLDKCLTVINMFYTMNGGLYIPKAIRINGLMGIFMVNKDGSIHYSSRVIKIAEDKYKIEHLSNEADYQFEREYTEIIEA
jgi:hypothetical protein